MSDKSLNSQEFHLPNLKIEGFRGFRELEIQHLGRVNLIVGENSVGKSSLLDAVKVYASERRYPTLIEILEDHDEVADDEDEDGRSTVSFNWDALFFGRRMVSDSFISIGKKDGTSQIRVAPANTQGSLDGFDDALSDRLPSLEVTSGGNLLERVPLVPMDFYRRNFRLFRNGQNQDSSGTVYQSLGPDVIGNHNMARLWDGVALTDDEALAEHGLNLIFHGEVERVGMIGDDRGPRSRYGRIAIARVKGERRPVPLRSLGEGATRMLGVALALSNSRDGFLLIDEIENGVYYEILPDLWKMVLKAAHENNIQVFATTHSWECIEGFARAVKDEILSEEIKGIDVTLTRLDRHGDEIRTVEYSKENLLVAAEQGIEVR